MDNQIEDFKQIKKITPMHLKLYESTQQKVTYFILNSE